MAFTRPSERQKPREETPKNVEVRELADDSALVVIRKIENKPEIQTVNGVADAVSVDLLIVSGRHQGTFEEDRLIFNSGLLDTLEVLDKGEVTAGRIVWRPTKKRKMAVLDDPSERDEAEAEAAWNKHTRG